MAAINGRLKDRDVKDRETESSGYSLSQHCSCDCHDYKLPKELALLQAPLPWTPVTLFLPTIFSSVGRNHLSSVVGLWMPLKPTFASTHLPNSP